MWPVFCRNYECQTQQSDLDRLFSRYGKIVRIEMKSEYAFVYFEDENDAAKAIRELQGKPFGSQRLRLHVKWAVGKRRGHHGDLESNPRPSRTLFVKHFDPVRTQNRDIEKHFEPYGRVLNVRMSGDVAFVHFETQEDATRALELSQNSMLFDTVPRVEYAFKEYDARHRRKKRKRRNYASSRLPSPAYRHRRASPVYDRHAGPSNPRARSPKRLLRASPVYDRYEGPTNPRARSPKRVLRASPVYDRYEGPTNPRARSPKRVLRASPVYDRYEGPTNPRARSPDRARARSCAKVETVMRK
ncbi:serine/arginine-rich splicing factor RS31-like [Salvia splendens]|uniref:serine/arginine-rich splicing factor RS31-like n=1 Tax=Salvia splendens TaxID=180675 RepID=UPI001C27B746|nr:serine/arginine-rich splicing factor RS31-like [Salvia splendens]XP_041997977.1 serine/arginine-rich splicing factor RS31-like [Salvia splendens]